MVLQMFSVFDKKTVVYGRPFCAHNKGHAIRSIQDEMSNQESMLCRHPADFALYHIGSYDDTTGSIIVLAPVVVCEIQELVVKVQDK